MGTISVNDITGGTTAEAADVNANMNIVADELNGQLDNANIASDAAIDLTKLASPAWTAYSATLVGWSGTPTQDNSYTQVGKTVVFQYDITGTSNSTSTTITLPVTAAAGNFETCTGLAKNNSTTDISPARAFHSNTTTLSLQRLAGSGTWANSGTKQVRGIHTYEAA